MSDDQKLIERLLADEPALLTSLDFGPFVAQGTGSGPSLLIGDLSEISLMRPAHETFLEHRMAQLAKPGDVVLVQNRDPDFETYLNDLRGIHDLTIIGIDTIDDTPVAKQALASQPILDRLVEITRSNGGLTIKSYLTTGTIWRLAQSIGETARYTVHVCGPSPRICKRVNDKLWFTQVARDVIGGDAVPPTMSAYGPDAAAGLIMHYAGKDQQVIVKVPDSAGSAGNVRLDNERFANLSTENIKQILLDRLHATGWADIYPILVGVWDRNVTCTPSVQMWIPRPETGPPQALGVFEQRVLGDVATFVGAVASTLPDAMKDALVDQASRIARVFQHLGYYGSCSFDAVICDRDIIHWIECNGRWSGVSIPLAALKRRSGGATPKGIVIVQEKLPGIRLGTAQALDALDDVLDRNGNSDQGVVLMAPPVSTDGSALNLLVFAPTQDDANHLGARAIALLKKTI